MLFPMALQMGNLKCVNSFQRIRIVLGNDSSLAGLVKPCQAWFPTTFCPFHFPELFLLQMQCPSSGFELVLFPSCYEASAHTAQLPKMLFPTYPLLISQILAQSYLWGSFLLS